MNSNNPNEEKICALYIRVSTDAQAEEGYSIPAQTEKLEAYCAVKGWKRFDLYVDGGYSGSNLNRPEIQRLIADAQAGRLGNVVVYKLDRLSRSQKDTLYLIEDVFLPNEVGFVSINENFDTTTPFGRAMIGILSVFAQLERENIYLRTRMGMLERVKQGLWRGGGNVPFGYDYDQQQGILVPNQDAETVRKIYDLYIQGYSTSKIAGILGLPHERLVSNVLGRRCYLGLVTYKGQEYPGCHEAILSEDTYELAVRKMHERSIAHAPVKASHLLTGIIYCGCCGGRLRYQKWGKAGFKLVCYSHDPAKAHMVRDPDCAYEPVWSHQIESIVLGDLFNISADMRSGKEADAYTVIDPVAELKNRIRQTENKLERLYTLYAEGTDDTLLKVIEDTKQALVTLQAQYEQEKEDQASARRLALIRDQVAGIAETWPYLTDLQKQTMIRDCVSRIVITNERVQIFYTFKQSGGQQKSA